MAITYFDPKIARGSDSVRVTRNIHCSVPLSGTTQNWVLARYCGTVVHGFESGKKEKEKGKEKKQHKYIFDFTQWQR